jgi:hypothetical protein
MSPRTWRLSVFLLLLCIGLFASYTFLTLLWLLGVANTWGLIPVAGSILLFATCGMILLWPRIGSLLSAVFLLCIGPWAVMFLISDFAHPTVVGVAIDFVVIAVVALGLWLTLREAFGFTSHKLIERGTAYTGFAVLVIIGLPALTFANFYSTHGQVEMREFPKGFHGQAIIVWNEPAYPPLPIRNGKLIEHFPTDGVIVTSTQLRGGWAKDELYFYDSTGRYSAKPEAIAHLGTGGFSDSTHQMTYSEIFIGTQDEYGSASFDEHGKQIHEMLRKVHPDIAE